MKEPESMKKIHKIMEKLHDERKNMTRKEVVEDISSGANDFIKKYGLKIETARSKVTFGK